MIEQQPIWLHPKTGESLLGEGCTFNVANLLNFTFYLTYNIVVSISKHSVNGKVLSKIISNVTEGKLEESTNQTIP